MGFPTVREVFRSITRETVYLHFDSEAAASTFFHRYNADGLDVGGIFFRVAPSSAKGIAKNYAQRPISFFYNPTEATRQDPTEATIDNPTHPAEASGTEATNPTDPTDLIPTPPIPPTPEREERREGVRMLIDEAAEELAEMEEAIEQQRKRIKFLHDVYNDM